MQLSNDTSKNSTSPPYLVKNEWSLMHTMNMNFSTLFQLNQLNLTSGAMRIKFHLYLKKAGLASKNKVIIKVNIY